MGADMDSMTATEAITKRDEERQREVLHKRIQWFMEKHAPIDVRYNAEFQADFMMVVQDIHRDASTHTHELLSRSLAAMPPPYIKSET
jgi:hypothetical protein